MVVYDAVGACIISTGICTEEVFLTDSSSFVGMCVCVFDDWKTELWTHPTKMMILAATLLFLSDITSHHTTCCCDGVMWFVYALRGAHRSESIHQKIIYVH